MDTPARPDFVPVGTNETRVFGVPARERACRLAAKAGLECSDAPRPDAPTLLANIDYAWDPLWLKMLVKRPGAVIVCDGVAVLAHLPAGSDIDRVHAGDLTGFEQLDAATVELTNDELRKRERPFVLPLTEQTADQVERAAYDGAYKGVTDALTLYVWRKPAFYLTRWAAQAGISPNMVSLVGAACCILAFYLFWIGQYWPGMLSGFVFMVLDTVDGKLARCTGTASWWGNVLDHGVDLVHPPFWWWAWLHGLGAYGRPLEPVYAANLLAVIVIGYVMQRVFEGIFLARFGLDMHTWRPIDSQFRLITARRNPNMAILLAALLFGRPDVGIELVALWTLLSLIFHAVRIAQAETARQVGGPIRSWLS
ncbi:CDP-alcohol phosphatidyltransferase family protein [Sphingomonas sinipercae]|uniref:CDP-alcohol phosphatidyltransferase family protein n=1 Tax=Sphingomonas sinipercae TaxID=2714944 RepID=A0A6G7ZLF8_9SPHN|nr:CDP-alcohol phosphatidyltransferase family protein [Sphingomonas sinipercae]QIL01762.1 CDP-alcohol phosphatidyltransferase family protein [Sphingomonas sinipercae]